MAVKAQLVGGGTSGDKVEVYDRGLLVSPIPFPPLVPQKTVVFSQYLTDDGLSSGSNDMGVDGSGTAVRYWIPASEEADRYVTRLDFVVGYGTAGKLYHFADSGAALTNGVRITYDQPRVTGGEVEIDNVKVNYEFIGFSGIRLVPTAWELRNLGAANDYGYMITADLARIMPPFGVKLDKGTTEMLVITIRDDCTDADTFNCQAFGFDRVE